MKSTLSDSSVTDHFLRPRSHSTPIWCLALYLPLGICLVLMRIALSVILFFISFFLPRNAYIKRFIFKLACMPLGVVVKTSRQRPSPHSSVWVANRVGVLDHVAVSLVTSIDAVYFPSTADASSISKLTGWFLGYKHHLRNGREVSKTLLKVSSSQGYPPILLQPEPLAVPSNNAILQFDHRVLDDVCLIQPLAITYYRPLDILMSSYPQRSLLFDLFLFAYTPFTIFHIRFLEPIKRSASHSWEPNKMSNYSQDSTAFAACTQQLIADAINGQVLPDYQTVISRLEERNNVLRLEQAERRSRSGRNTFFAVSAADSRRGGIQGKKEEMIREEKRHLWAACM